MYDGDLSTLNPSKESGAKLLKTAPRQRPAAQSHMENTMLSVAQWKEHAESTIRQNPQNYLNFAIPDIATAVEAHLKTSSFADLGDQITVTFADDEKIQQYLDGVSMPDVCCIVCVKILGFKQSAVPHNGPCNVCR